QHAPVRRGAGRPPPAGRARLARPGAHGRDGPRPRGRRRPGRRGRRAVRRGRALPAPRRRLPRDGPTPRPPPRRRAARRTGAVVTPGAYRPGGSLLHRAPAGAKLVGLATASAAVLLATSPAAVGGAVLAVAALYALAGVG